MGHDCQEDRRRVRRGDEHPDVSTSTTSTMTSTGMYFTMKPPLHRRQWPNLLIMEEYVLRVRGALHCPGRGRD